MHLGARLMRQFDTPQRVGEMAQRILDTHVHLSDTARFTYPWANASLGVPCPAAPPALCNWTLADYSAATPPPHAAGKLVFVEVAVAAAQWLDEARWV